MLVVATLLTAINPSLVTCLQTVVHRVRTLNALHLQAHCSAATCQLADAGASEKGNPSPQSDGRCTSQKPQPAVLRITAPSVLHPQVLAELPAPGWAVSDADLAGRRDLRGERVFSIDPPTARDLDDALSVQRLPGGDLRVGVHIADVSHFVRWAAALV